MSHHILRLAYCRSADLRAWYLQQEAALFKARFRELAPGEQVDFFKAQGLPYRAIDAGEFEDLKPLLAAVAASSGDHAAAAAISAGERTLFFRVPFAAVPDLVATRRVLLRGGVALVAQEQVYSLVVGAFRAHLSSALAALAQRWGAFAAAEGGRLAPLVEAMPTRSLSAGEGKKLPAGEITAGQVHQLAAERHLPPCMALMYERLASEHHLKHYGLQQMSLFLKHVGLPLEQALLFWRSMFAPRTPAEKFNREYAYNIRYNYAQVRKLGGCVRADWLDGLLGASWGGEASAALLAFELPNSKHSTHKHANTHAIAPTTHPFAFLAGGQAHRLARVELRAHHPKGGGALRQRRRVQRRLPLQDARRAEAQGAAGPHVVLRARRRRRRREGARQALPARVRDRV